MFVQSRSKSYDGYGPLHSQMEPKQDCKVKPSVLKLGLVDMSTTKNLHEEIGMNPLKP